MNPARAAHPHSLSLDGTSRGQDVVTAMATHRLYALSEVDAYAILDDGVEAVSSWASEAERADIPAA